MDRGSIHKPFIVLFGTIPYQCIVSLIDTNRLAKKISMLGKLRIFSNFVLNSRNLSGVFDCCNGPARSNSTDHKKKDSVAAYWKEPITKQISEARFRCD